MPNTSRLPTELTDEIIGYLHTDRPALRTCTLVCKTWLPRSRHFLVGYLKLKPSNSGLFFRLIDSPLSTITSHVHSLHIQREYGGGGPLWFKDLLPRLIIFADTVTSITLTLANFLTMEAESTYEFWSSFRSLEHLGLMQCRFISFAQLAGLLCACPELQRLSLTSLSWHFDDVLSVSREMIQRPLILQKVELTGSGQAAVLDWLEAGEVLPPISEVTLHSISADNVAQIGSFLRALGSSLRCLKIDGFSPCYNDEGYVLARISQEIDLAFNTQLRVLHFDTTYLNSKDTKKRTKEKNWISKVLSRITSPHMNAVVFNVRTDGTRGLEQIDWDGMSSVFGSDAFASLRKVQFQMKGQLKRKKARRFIKQKLMIFDARGVLVVQDEDSLDQRL